MNRTSFSPVTVHPWPAHRHGGQSRTPLLLIGLAGLWWACLPVAAQELGGSARADYSAFRLIGEKNIFDASRSGRSAPPPPSSTEERRLPRVDGFTLVGTMNYDKGPFAFFDGTRSDYRAVLPPGASIGGCKITAIAGQQVKLEDGTNRFEMNVGSQLRREDDGPWQLHEHAELLASTSGRSERSSFGQREGRGEDSRRGDSRGFDSRRGEARGNDSRGSSLGREGSAPSTPAPASAAVKLTPEEESEILKRLMQQREQETK